MLDAVERGLLAVHFPGVGYGRLEGSTPAQARGAIAARFNSDPQQRVLLLTTGAGGLGLNLTGADTVVFLDHDWNPSRDAQAQDRAHRLGQTRAVTVYRILAQGTVEEAVMGQQTWKLGVAGAIVGRANGSLAGGVGTAPILEFLGGGARAPPPAQQQQPQLAPGSKRVRSGGGQAAAAAASAAAAAAASAQAQEEAAEAREVARAAEEAAALAMLHRR
jgi:TATA-binding protein-associated factor